MSSEVIPGEQKSWTETPPANPPLRRAIAEVVENQTWLDTLADPIQNWLLTFFGQPGDPTRSLKNVLNGTWLGHALHPVLTDVPIGSWSATLLLDLAWLANEDEGIARAADLTLVLGLLGATGSAITGATDWSDTYGPDRRVGLLHGLLNVSIAATNTVSWFLRMAGRRRTGIALSTAGYLTALFTAYLGGELSFAKGIGVNHDAWEGGSEDFVAVMSEQDLPENKLTRVNAGGIPAVLLKRGSKIYAIGAVCTHQAGPLDEGTTVAGENGPVVQCPWHGSQFSMSDGRVVCGPAVYAQPTFAVRIRNGQIELRRLDHA